MVDFIFTLIFPLIVSVICAIKTAVGGASVLLVRLLNFARFSIIVCLCMAIIFVTCGCLVDS